MLRREAESPNKSAPNFESLLGVASQSVGALATNSFFAHALSVHAPAAL
ncbi:MAG: hypothetical protein ACKODX_15375 [Gemmata sp.]